MNNKLVNIIVHSYYTFLQSSLSINEIVDFAVSNNLKYASLVDINVMYGAIEFYKQCLQNQIKPIIGIQIKYQNSDLVLIAKNYHGYKKLMQISSIVMTSSLNELEPLISDDLYLIILNGDFNLNSENVFTVASNQSNSIAAREVFYFNYDGYKTSLILEAIKNDETLDCQNPFVENLTNKFLTPDEFDNEFDSNAIANLEKLVSNIDIVLPDNNEISIIKYENNLNLTSKDYLIKITNENLEKYLLANSELDKQVYRQRLNFELEVINNKKFEDYFLVVQDFINFAKNNHIMTGPGRGSAAGSLVAFVLGITKIDPIKYNLLFERFLNIERVNMPDIDTDVMDTKREEIIDYIFEKYGKNHTAHIITFSKIKAKQAIRDIGRVFNVDLNIINKICKNIKPEFEDNIIDAIVNENKWKKFSKNITVLKEEFLQNKFLFEYSQKIIGFPRQSGMHAAGIILSNDEITTRVPVQSTINNKIMTQFSMDYLEELGLIKIDILGLRNLTIISQIIKLIEGLHHKTINLLELPIDDKNVFKLFQEGNTNGIFQFESPGMKNTLKAIHPQTIEELSIVSAIYRPGANEQIDQYIKNKNNKYQSDNFSNLEIQNVLEQTHGIIIYQEQIINLVQIIANFSKFKADSFRKAISKKKEDLILKEKSEFIVGATKNGFSIEQAHHWFDTIAKFAGYGFNHSHSLSYAFISYWIAYLKTYYPRETFSILLSNSEIDNVKIQNYFEEAKKSKIDIKGPDINLSSLSFVLFKNAIYFSFTSIAGIGLENAKKIISIRKAQPDGKFHDVIKAIAILVLNGISKSVISNLIKVGVFDNLNNNREFLLSNIDILTDKKKIIMDSKQNFVFDLDLKEVSNDKKANYAKYELELLGINISPTELAILFNSYYKEYQLVHLDEINQDGVYKIICQIQSIYRKTSQSNHKYFEIKLIENNNEFYLTTSNDINLQKFSYYILEIKYNKFKNKFYLNAIIKEV